MNIIASDAIKNTKWDHMVKTKTKGLLSITCTRNKVYPHPHTPSLIHSRNDTLLNQLNFPRSKHSLTLFKQWFQSDLNSQPLIFLQLKGQNIFI